jgi:hypothetical protein
MEVGQLALTLSVLMCTLDIGSKLSAANGIGKPGCHAPAAVALLTETHVCDVFRAYLP